ncbi:MAG: iron-containing redox enzyme family protein [Byssovorax sp.]
MSHDYVSIIERESTALVDSIDRNPLIGSVIRGDASRAEYVAFLGATYHYLRWSGPLLAETAEGLRLRGRCPWLLAIVDAKTAEESPHDGWVLSDLRSCGENVELVKAQAAPRAVDAYVQWSRTMAQEGSPAFLGAAYTLEFISMHRAKTAADNLRAHRAIPNIEEAVSFLEGHGDADVGHIELLSEILRRIEDPRDQDAIALSAAVMRALYPRFFQPTRA